MPLEEFEKKLYSGQEPPQEKPIEGAKPKLAPSPMPPIKKVEFPESEELSKKKFFIWVILMVGLVAAVVYFALFLGQRSFSEKNVVIQIQGPKEFKPGELVDFKVSVLNRTRVPLENSELSFFWPEGSQVENISGTIKQDLNSIQSGEQRTIDFEGRVFGEPNSDKEFKARLDFKPTNINSNFFKEVSITEHLIASPLNISLKTLNKVALGQVFNLEIEYANTSDAAFENIELEAEYPANFTFISSDPQPNRLNNVWHLGTISPSSSGKIKVRGMLENSTGSSEIKFLIGEVDENKKFFILSSAGQSIEIVKPALAVEINVNNSRDYVASLNDNLSVQINYENTTDFIFQNVTITMKLSSQLVDLSSIFVDEGTYDAKTNTIIWNPTTLSKLSQLSGHDSGTVKFSIRTKKSFNIASRLDKNFIIPLQAKITSASSPEELAGLEISGTDTLSLKVNSDIKLKISGFYYSSLLPNTGPIPPKVGQQTTYTIFWQITNSSNDLSDVSIKANLPPYIKWLSQFSPTNANLNYDPSSGLLIWSIGRMSAGVGHISPTKFVAFRIGLTPGINQAGDSPTLMTQAAFSAHDDFTGTDYNITGKEITTYLQDDLRVGFQGSKVQP